MLKQISCFRKRQDLDLAQFQQHWRTRHADIVRELPGLKGYIQNHVRQGDAVNGVAEVWFDSIDDMRANVGHPTLARIRADEPNFMDTDSMMSIVAEPETIIEGEQTGSKLIVLVKRNPAVEPERFHRIWREDVGGAMRAASTSDNAPRRYEQDHARASSYRDGREPKLDGTASLWFESPDAAMAFFGSPAFAQVAAAERDLMDQAAVQAIWVEPLVMI